MTGVMSGTWGRGTGSTEGRGVRFARGGTTPVDPTGNWRAVCAERCKHGSREGPTEKGESTSLAAYSTVTSAQSGYQPWVCQRAGRELGTRQTPSRGPRANATPAPVGAGLPSAVRPIERPG